MIGHHDPDRMLSEQIETGEEGIHAKLDRLLAAMGALEQRVAAYEGVLGQVPGLMALMTDTVDDVYRQTAASGIVIEDRLRAALGLLETVSQPEMLASLSALMTHLPMLERLVDQAPGLLAMLADIGDDLYSEAKRLGIDLDTLARDTLGALRTLVGSGVLDAGAIKVVGSAGAALAESQRADAGAGRVGVIALVRALGDADTQYALGFLLRFAKHFGKKLSE